MKYFFGLLISATGFYFAGKHLNQDISEYWDEVAFFVVSCGTLAVMLMSVPAGGITVHFVNLIKKFFYPKTKMPVHARECLDFALMGSTSVKKNIETQLLIDGKELISLGFKKDETLRILADRFESYVKRIEDLSFWLKRCSKYPPAFGLAGTVLGLIHLMRGISSGIDAKEIGIRMAVALVATFYGLIASNLVLNPLGEWLKEEIKRDEALAEMSLKAIDLAYEGCSPVEAQESLNSYLAPSERVKAANTLTWDEVA